MKILTRRFYAICVLLIALLVLGGCMVAPSQEEGHVEEEDGHAEELTDGHAEEVDGHAEVAFVEVPADGHADVAPSGLINLNDMSEERLMTTIPGFTELMAHEFLEHQPYPSIQQFRRDVGAHISDEQLTFYEKHVFVPVDINESDGETLKQIPGVDGHVAEELMTNRPYDSQEEFLEILASFLTAEQLEVTPIYLED